LELNHLIRVSPSFFKLRFVSSNAWDALAATWYGYQTLWVNRHQQPFEELGTLPARTGSSLRAVLDFFPSPPLNEV
jgi:2-haloacid dehalogenase